MINILSMNIVGSVNKLSKMLFTFSIDNSTELPKQGIYQLGDKIYVIAEGSTAVDIVDKIVYKFTKDKWVRTKDTYNPPTTSANTITTNGNHTVASNMLTGVTDINTNVEVTGLIEKEITENGEYLPADDDATAYSKIIANVPNTYTAQDEGKVVDNGELVVQTAMPSSIIQNGTVNTTLYNSVTVDVTPPSNEFYPTVKTQGLMAQNDTGSTWITKTWNGPTSISGRNIWTDGDNIYYSPGSSHYVLNKSTSTWSSKTWSGLTEFAGSTVWSDGDNLYCNKQGPSGYNSYILDKATSTWSAKTWSGLTNFSADGIWTDGDNIYYSSVSDQYVLNKSTSTWSAKTWSGLTNFYGYNIWTDGDNIYYSSGSKHYVLNKSTSTWSAKTWSGLTNFEGYNIWTDGDNIYHSNSTVNQSVLNKSTSTWSAKTWSGLDVSTTNGELWTDGDNIYYSSSSGQYYLPIIKKSFPRTAVKPE